LPHVHFGHGNYYKITDMLGIKPPMVQWSTWSPNYNPE